MSPNPPAPKAWQPPADSDLNAEDVQLLRVVAQSAQADPNELHSMLEGIRRGETQAEYFGFTPEVLAALEAMALGFYRGQRYREARSIFGLVVRISDGERGAAWRGLGACAQAEFDYTAAIEAYSHAVLCDPKDVHSAVFLGECLCVMGRREDGVQVLGEVLADVAPARAKEPHILRARAIVAAKGGIAAPPQAASATETPTAQTALPKAPDAWRQAADRDAAFDPDARDVLASPEGQRHLDALAEAVREGRTTLRHIADFTQEQMDAAYAIACQLLERGEALKAAEMAGWMLYIDRHDTRFYRLAGLCMHHLKLWCLADFLYDLVGIWRDGGADAATLMYQGEVKLMLDERDAGVDLLQRGVEAAGQDPVLAEVSKRGKLLLWQINQAATPNA